ncbi:LysR substrate-binding domain-containing protein [Jiella mangrovi]
MRGIRKPTTIAIRATPTIATKWLLPRLGDFLAREPGTEVHLDGSNEPVDFTRDAVDLEIRHGTGGWPGLHVEPLTSERFLPVCSPSLAGPGTLSFEDFVRFRLIQSVKAQIQWATGFDAVGIAEPRIAARLSFDRSHMAIEAASLGLGIALESELMMESELRSGRLVVPVSRTPELRMSTQWLVCPRSNLRKRRVVRLLEWLREKAIEWQENSPANSIDFLPK